MTKREQALKRLQEISDEEMRDAIKELTLHVKARLRFGSLADRTKSGAHSEASLGVDPIDYYVGDSIKRLFDPDGWEWKFERFTLAEQLKRIANKLLSDSVERYKRRKENAPVIVEKDVSEIYDLPDQSGVDEETFTRLRDLAYEVAKDDDNLAWFTLRYFEGATDDAIAGELKIKKEEVYVLRKKLVRRLVARKDELTE